MRTLLLKTTQKLLLVKSKLTSLLTQRQAV